MAIPDAFMGLEYCFVSNLHDAHVFNLVGTEYGTPPGDLFRDLWNHDARAQYWPISDTLNGCFRQSIRQHGLPPRRFKIALHPATHRPIEDLDTFHFDRVVLNDNWLYIQPLIGATIMVRRTYSLPMQLDSAHFPACSWTPTDDGLCVPMEGHIVGLAGNSICRFTAPLNTQGFELARVVLAQLKMSCSWDIHFVNTKGDLLEATQSIGEWSFGPKQYLFAVPKAPKETPDAAIASYFLNPIRLAIQR